MLVFIIKKQKNKHLLKSGFMQRFWHFIYLKYELVRCNLQKPAQKYGAIEHFGGICYGNHGNLNAICSHIEVDIGYIYPLPAQNKETTYDNQHHSIYQY